MDNFRAYIILYVFVNIFMATCGLIYIFFFANDPMFQLAEMWDLG